jgi:protein involved in polysaccharide export with SLBB domain
MRRNNAHKEFQASGATRIWTRGFALWVIAAAFGAGALFAQSNRSAPEPSSDLARENLSHVSASAAELKAVLLKDSGLMVELKRWVAKDATDHGQVISDSDLTNDAMFDRLDTDSRFRSLATDIVQRYGYLQPEVNPDSELGKQRALLIQERTKWIAQQQEEELAESRRTDLQKLQKAKACDSVTDSDPDCSAEQSKLPREQAQPQGTGGAPSRAPGAPYPFSPANPPDQINPPAMPGGQLLEASGEGLNNFPIGVSGGGGSGQGRSSFGVDEVSEERDSFTRRLSNDPTAQLNAEFAAQNGAGGIPGATNGQTLDGLDSARQSLSGGNPYTALGPDLNGPSGLIAVSPVGSASRLAQQNALLQPVEMVRQRSPYDDIPSLYDMYLQAVPRPATPRRFGSEVFQNGTRDPQLIPMDLPVGPDYVVGPGDGLSIDVWGGVSQRIFRTVDREGRVSIPEVGPVLVSGKSLADLQQDLQRMLRTEFRDVSAEVSLARLRTIRVYEVGDVANPGAYDISSLSTPLNALFAAGGPTQKGSLRIVKHLRGNQLVQTVDLYDLLLHGVKGDIVRLENGDTVMVPPIGSQVTVEGMVRRPSIYELKDEGNLAAVLELAGGLLPSAALRHIEVQRLVAHDKQTMLSFDIPDGASFGPLIVIVCRATSRATASSSNGTRCGHTFCRTQSRQRSCDGHAPSSRNPGCGETTRSE